MSDCAVPSRFGREYQDLLVLQDEQASALQRLLRTHWHLQLLSDFVTQTSCRQGRNQHPFDKEQTLFLVQLRLAVFRLDLVWKEQCTSVCTEDHSSTPAERDGQETKLVSELHTLGKALELFVLLEVCMSPVVLRLVGVELHLQSWIPGSGNGTFCPGFEIGQA